MGHPVGQNHLMRTKSKLLPKGMKRNLAGHVAMPGTRVLAGAAVFAVQEVVGQAGPDGLRPQNEKVQVMCFVDHWVPFVYEPIQCSGRRRPQGCRTVRPC